MRAGAISDTLGRSRKYRQIVRLAGMSETEGLCEEGSLSRQSVDIGRIGRIDNLAIGVILFNHENDVIWSGERGAVIAMS